MGGAASPSIARGTPRGRNSGIFGSRTGMPNAISGAMIPAVIAPPAPAGSTFWPRGRLGSNVSRATRFSPACWPIAAAVHPGASRAVRLRTFPRTLRAGGMNLPRFPIAPSVRAVAAAPPIPAFHQAFGSLGWAALASSKSVAPPPKIIPGTPT